MLAILNALAVGTCMSYVTPYFVLFYVRERVCRSKHLQLVSGTAVSVFWLVAFFWDFTIFIVISSCMLLIFLCYSASINYGKINLCTSIFLRLIGGNYRGHVRTPPSFRFRHATYGVSTIVLIQETIQRLFRD